MSDTISKKGVFIPDITVEMFRNASLESIEDLMASGEMEDILLPSAQPEIIWCKDCKHWDGVDTCDVIDAPVWDNDFCSMAERRGEQDEEKHPEMQDIPTRSGARVIQPNPKQKQKALKGDE